MDDQLTLLEELQSLAKKKPAPRPSNIHLKSNHKWRVSDGVDHPVIVRKATPEELK